MNLIKLSNCPICDSDDLSLKAHIQDLSISKEIFQISECNDCKFLFTNPQPSLDELWRYYESEDYISHSKTSKGFINFWYSLIQKLNLKLKFDAIKGYVPRGTWIDYGAGAGDFVKYVRQYNYDIIGFEPSTTARDTAQKNGVTLQDTSEIGSIKTNTIACITLWHVLEHIPNFTQILHELSDLLVDEGIIILALPNHQSLDAKIYGDYWAAYDVPRHLWHFQKSDILRLAQSLQLKLIDTKGMIFDSTYVSLLSEKYKNGSKLSGIINGVKSNVSAIQKSTPYSSQIYVLQKKRS